MKKEIKLNLATFDFAKGVAVLGIILGHMFSHYDAAETWGLIPVSALLFLLQNAVNPMFFIASGFGFREKPAKKMLVKTSQELLKPYLYVTVLIALLFPLVHFLFYRWWPGAFQEALRYVLAFVLGVPKAGKNLLGYSLYECSVMWFFLTLFLSLNLLNRILKLKNEAARTVCVAACVLCGYLLTRLDFDYFCLPQGLLAVGYCYLGYQIKKQSLLTDGKPHGWLYAVLALASVLQLLLGGFNLAYGEFRLGLMDYVASCCAGVLFLIFCVFFGQREWKCLDWVKQVGVYSYWIMCIHSVELICIPWYLLPQTLSGHRYLAFLMEVLLKCAIIGTGCFVLKKISRRIYKRRIKSIGK